MTVQDTIKDIWFFAEQDGDRLREFVVDPAHGRFVRWE